MMKVRGIFVSFLCGLMFSHANAEHGSYKAVIFESHIHYDEDVWNALPPPDAIKMLQDQKIAKALVSATPTEGAEMLYREDPELVIPMLRPYKSWRHRYLWFKDPELKEYLLEHLSRVPYRGFGEFHVFSENMDTEQVEDMIEIARERGLVLHPHTNIKGMKILLSKAADIPVIWAHGGFDAPLDLLVELFESYPKLYIDLSLRDGMLDNQGNLTAEWKSLLVDYRTRFLTGMDTYKPSRWADLPEIAAETRHWLHELPLTVAEDLSLKNLARIFDIKH